MLARQFLGRALQQGGRPDALGERAVGTPMHACNPKAPSGQLQCADPSDINRNGKADGGFEALPLGTGGFQYGPAGSAWAFVGSSGVAGIGSRFTAGNSTATTGGGTSPSPRWGRSGGAYPTT